MSFRREHGANLGVERVHAGRRPGLGFGERDVAEALRSVLQLNEDGDRQMGRVGIGPGFDLVQTDLQGEAARVIVGVLGVEHLDARPLHHGVVRTPVRGRSEQRRGKSAARGVEPDVELELTDLLRLQLGGQRRVAILEAFIVLPDELAT